MFENSTNDSSKSNGESNSVSQIIQDVAQINSTLQLVSMDENNTQNEVSGEKGSQFI